MYRILVSDKLGEPGIHRLRERGDVEFDIKTDLSHQELVDTIGQYDALIIRSATNVDADVLRAGRNLKVVGRAGIGIDNVDVKAATERGVIVMNTPQANALATAEHTLTLMLAVSRHTAHAHQSVARGEWHRTQYVGRQLAGKILGIIGFGQVGRLVTHRAQAFDMEVIAYDPYVSEQIGRDLGVTLVDMDELLEQSDYVSLHTSMSPETESMINAGTLSRVKPGAILINSARGRLVDESALAAALDSGRVAATAVDVFRDEPPGKDNPLLGRPNVLHTPHLGASTEEAQRDVAVQIVDQVMDALGNKDFRNSINMPFIAGPHFDRTLNYMKLAEKIGHLHFTMAPEPIRRIEIELQGDSVEDLLKPIAAALLKGLLAGFLEDSVNYVNAPLLAEEHGISVAQSKGIGAGDYSNLVSCRVHWADGKRTISGALFGGKHPRIVRVSKYHLDVDPTGIVLLMLNRDIPGVIGKIGSILGNHGVNIGEWRLGRAKKGDMALSFVNLDSHPPAAAIQELKSVPAVTKVSTITF